MRPSTAEHPTVFISEYSTPWGTLLLADLDGRIALCDWVTSPRFEGHLRTLPPNRFNADTPLIAEAKHQLDEYARNIRRDFNIPLTDAPTPFAAKVREIILTVPFGQTISYQQLAQLSGNPRAVRAVARAVACNPLSLLVPCHRIIGSDGSLTGYAGGLPAKQSLLLHEKRR